jgi:D-glycero-D-manno-heptose 1,7-bisphosphate phosphatase
MPPAIFLDRDGTIIREAEYLADPAGVELLPGVVEGLRALRAAGFLLIVVSNQSGVARGYFTEETVKKINQRLRDLLAREQADVDAVYYCPHYAKGNVTAYAIECECRKPKPGLILTAQKEWDIDLAHSWVVGDKDADVLLGKNAGTKTALVLTGYGEKTRAAGFVQGQEPDLISPNLGSAAQAVVRLARESKPWAQPRWGAHRRPVLDPETFDRLPDEDGDGE